MRVLVVNHITLDGVLQGPGRPDEDTRHDFEHGGWAKPGASDPAIGAALRERMGEGFSWLFGRRSYEGMLSHWNAVGGAFKDGLNEKMKYVATSNPELELPWPNSTLLSGDVPGAVAALREQPGVSLVIMGSGRLIRSLLPHGLVDELFLMIHPVVLGSGERPSVPPTIGYRSPWPTSPPHPRASSWRPTDPDPVVCDRLLQGRGLQEAVPRVGFS